MALSPELKKMVSQKKAQYSGGGGKTIKPKDGRNVYRLIAPTQAQAPWIPSTGQWWADLGVHWIKAEENGKPIAVVGDCDTVYQQPSPINTAVDMAINSAPDEVSKKLYESWRARKSILLLVVDRSTPGDDADVLELTPTSFAKVLDLYNLYDDAGQDITDPVNGADIIITRTGKGLNTNYDVAIAPSIPGQPFKAVPLETITRAPNLHDFIATNYFRGEEQKALNAIANIAGVAIPRLGTTTAGAAAAVGVRTPTAALASPAASVADATVDTTPVTAAAAPVTPAEDALAAKRAEILRRQQEAEAELAALSAATPAVAQTAPAAAATAAPAPGLSSLSASDQDAILAELDNLV